MAAIHCLYKIENRMQIVYCGIRELRAAPIHGNIPLRELNLNLKNRDDI
jgi:hypothetical protein